MSQVNISSPAWKISRPPLQYLVRLRACLGLFLLPSIVSIQKFLFADLIRLFTQVLCRLNVVNWILHLEATALLFKQSRCFLSARIKAGVTHGVHSLLTLREEVSSEEIFIVPFKTSGFHQFWVFFWNWNLKTSINKTVITDPKFFVDQGIRFPSY